MADNAWSSVGVRTWHKMTSCGLKEKGKLAKHFRLKAHKAALADFYAFCQESSNVDMPLDKERGVNAIQERQGWEFLPDRIKALPTREKVVE